jgi:uncharacterized protein (DUF2252 family)
MVDAEMSARARAEDVRRSIDGWNTGINYWDRRTKYGKMMATCHAFYRGTAQLFWRDFAADPRLETFGNEGTVTWLEGDAHAYNFGAFSNDRDALLYDMNDFDESVVADYQLDLWRLAVSVVLIVRANGNLSNRKTGDVLDAMSAKYLSSMRACSHDRDADKVSFTQDAAYGVLDDFLREIKEDNSREGMLDRWAPEGDGGARRFDLANPKLGSVTQPERQALLDAMDDYWGTIHFGADAPSTYVQSARPTVRDVARRLLAGTGSLGTARYYLLLEDRAGGLHILDIKQQRRPSAYAHLSDARRADYDRHAGGNDARAHAVAHRALSSAPDPFLGWMRLGEGWFSVRQRCPYKGVFPALLADATGDYRSLKLDSKPRYTKLAEQWGSILAADHAHAERVETEERGDGETLTAQITAATSGREDDFAALVRAVAFAYADQVEADWASFVDGLGADIVPLG